MTNFKSFLTEIRAKSFRTSTSRTSVGGASESKIRRVDANSFDDLSVWNAIMSCSQTKVEKFDELKHNPRVWLGQLESAIVAVGGIIETHSLGVLPFGLEKEGSKWYLRFDMENPNANWQFCKNKFIENFESVYAKQLRNAFVQKKATEKFEAYAKVRMELAKRLFPSLSQAELNLFVMAGLDEKEIKLLKKQKDASKETFLVLCATLDEINTPAVDP